MLPKWHLLFSFVLSYVLIFFFHFSLLAGLIIFLSASIIIDLDHIIFYAFKFREISPTRFTKHFLATHNRWKKLSIKQRATYKRWHFFFHSLEFLILLGVLTTVHKVFLWILFGFLFHLVLDHCQLIYEEEHPSVKVSQIWIFQRNKNKKEFL